MVNRIFTYQKGKCQLLFNLRIDIKNELRDFKQLLEEALEDVSEELSKYK